MSWVRGGGHFIKHQMNMSNFPFANCPLSITFHFFHFPICFPAVFRVDPSDNGATYKCTGENSASSVPIKAMTTITVHCEYYCSSSSSSSSSSSTATGVTFNLCFSASFFSRHLAISGIDLTCLVWFGWPGRVPATHFPLAWARCRWPEQLWCFVRCSAVLPVSSEHSCINNSNNLGCILFAESISLSSLYSLCLGHTFCRAVLGARALLLLLLRNTHTHFRAIVWVLRQFLSEKVLQCAANLCKCWSWPGTRLLKKRKGICLFLSSFTFSSVTPVVIVKPLQPHFD